MQNCKASTFYASWLSSVKSKKEILLKNWRNAKVFTELIKGSDSSIISMIANNLNLLSYERDYYSIDSVLYEENDRLPNTVNNTFWFRDIKIAFEHENYCNKRIYEEICHLLIVNSILKVFVTYPNKEKKDVLDRIHKIISDTRFSSELDSEESFLVIFGYENEFQWEGYIYKKDDWKQILFQE